LERTEPTADAFYVHKEERIMSIDDRRDDDISTGVDPDRTEGSLKQAGGKIKEGAGKLFGDQKLKAEGKADQGEGKLQNAWGSLKDSTRDAVRGEDEDV
jgi:uncharacterized protein YjbJ (UPF0337 family)